MTFKLEVYDDTYDRLRKELRGVVTEREITEVGKSFILETLRLENKSVKNIDFDFPL